MSRLRRARVAPPYDGHNPRRSDALEVTERRPRRASEQAIEAAPGLGNVIGPSGKRLVSSLAARLMIIPTSPCSDESAGRTEERLRQFTVHNPRAWG
jgi:hypothetical protein